MEFLNFWVAGSIQSPLVRALPGMIGGRRPGFFAGHFSRNDRRKAIERPAPFARSLAFATNPNVL